MRRSLCFAGALALSAGVVQAQGPTRTYSYDSRYDDRDRAALGISTSSGGMRDTLGLLVSSVTAGGPADKAGIEEGNRLVSINGVNLRLSAADAREGDMDGIVNRRLIRELERIKAGDDVDLRVWTGGQTKAVKVKTVAVEDLPSRMRTARRELEDRPALGLSLSATGSRRDTLGMLVVRVTTDGPAEKAGIIEGDRVSAINGVGLRVAAEDAGDGYMSSARMNRYRRELTKTSVGEDVELRVLSNGQSKTIRIKPVRAGDLPRDRGSVMIIGDGAVSIGDMFPALPAIAIPPIAPMAPRAPRVFEFDGNFDDGVRIQLDPRARIEIERGAQDAARRAREMMEQLERYRYDIDRRADDNSGATIAPAPRARPSGRIAAAQGIGAGVGYGYGSAVEAAPVPPTPEAIAVSSTEPSMYAAAPAASTNSVAMYDGDDATFTLEGLRLARVNDDLAANLGRGSERGFLVLESNNRWRGLRAGDVLLEIDGRPVRDGSSALISLGTKDDHTATVIRDGRQRVVQLDVR
ncbi:MAG TPA: PDZ domain-containing protein [Gemmatimonadaceae bacterium]|jgi:serine protease Do